MRVTDLFCGYPWQLSHSVVLQAYFVLDFTTTVPPYFPPVMSFPAIFLISIIIIIYFVTPPPPPARVGRGLHVFSHEIISCSFLLPSFHIYVTFTRCCMLHESFKSLMERLCIPLMIECLDWSRQIKVLEDQLKIHAVPILLSLRCSPHLGSRLRHTPLSVSPSLLHWPLFTSLLFSLFRRTYV